MPWEDRYAEPGAYALYVHVPFCRQKCAYCDFHSRGVSHDDPRLAVYADSLINELRRAAAAGLLDHCRTAYIGGGTPTMLGQVLPKLAAAIRDACPGLTELSCEANPESLAHELAQALAAAGVTRLSIGVQSTSDAELQALGRIHTGGEAKQALKMAKKAGLDVSADLMCATPLQTPESWRGSLADVVACGVDHVSVYPLQIEEGTALDARLAGEEPAWNASDVQADRMEEAGRILTAAGLARYEVASYAHPGKECAHNLAYWTGRSYLGLGPSAAGMLSRVAFERLHTAMPQFPELPRDVARIRIRHMPATPTRAHRQDSPSSTHKASFELEYLSQAQAVSEDLMLAMRTAGGIGTELLTYAAMTVGEAKLSAALENLAARDLIQWNATRAAWTPTHQGWLLGNELYAALWDLAPTHETLTQEVTL